MTLSHDDSTINTVLVIIIIVIISVHNALSVMYLFCELHYHPSTIQSIVFHLFSKAKTSEIVNVFWYYTF